MWLPLFLQDAVISRSSILCFNAQPRAVRAQSRFPGVSAKGTCEDSCLPRNNAVTGVTKYRNLPY